MVETNLIGDNHRLTLSTKRARFLIIPLSQDSVFSFGSCKEGWYFRCIGLDP
ncbi:hypothetical protein ISN44_As01g023620 [Arabidopsis suecica]|uniref:Uncharacterized protein n=1 Tax=Arabidopsis suecica TaxID=45249 RepID=A0A8T2H6Z9_ARASU|nr:hypothetical protein ISN44_As01g023620 [Arabidopsis suecica]